jgi:phosphoglycerate dehydrogenase-like enzyme
LNHPRRQLRDAVIMNDGKSIGIIGMGDMGKMYARRLSDAGWK